MNDFGQTTTDDAEVPSDTTALKRESKVRRWLSKKRARWRLAISVAAALIGLTIGLSTSSATTPSSSVSVGDAASGALGSNARNVHYIGVNWPHHVFVNQDFRVVSAE